MSFSSLLLHERIFKAVEDAGYSKPTPIQKRAIPSILARKDIIGIAQTGTGKTAAFVLPILSHLCAETNDDDKRSTRLLIIAPTRELVSQINENIRTYAKYTNLRTVIVTGGIGEAQQIAKLESNVDIVIATPGRLQELMDRGHARFDKVDYLVLDEADRMLDMGFLPSIEEIVKPLPNKRQTLLFSATLSKPIEKLAKTFLTNPSLIEVEGRTNPAKTVKQFFYPVPKHLKTQLLLKLLDDHQYFAVIVFVRTRAEADVVTSDLRAFKIDAEAIHGDKTQQARVRALKWFKEHKLRVLVATDVAARGLDIPGVTHVINYDFPEQNEDYIHRIGRTGRAGSEGCALTFVTDWDGNKRVKLEKHIGLTLPNRKLEGFDYSVPAPEDDGKRYSKKDDPRAQRRDSKYSHANRIAKNRRDAKNDGAKDSRNSGRPGARKNAKPNNDWRNGKKGDVPRRPR